MYNEPTNRNPNFVRLPLTDDQKAQVRATTGKEVEAIELTPQELELLRLLVDGHHRKTAATALGISVNTVSFHLKRIYEKLQVRSRGSAIAKAVNEKLVPPRGETAG